MESSPRKRQSLRARWESGLGILRSAIVYRARPFKRRRSLDHYRQFVARGEVCFDIGAHLGDRTSVFRELGARVITVEPQPGLLRVLHWNFADDALVTIVGAAVGRTSGRATMKVSRRNPSVSSLSPEWVESVAEAPEFAAVVWEEEIEVRVITLDELIHSYGKPAFCKIDVEGFEPEVLAGLSYALPCLSFEFLRIRTDLAGTCVSRLEELGDYRFNLSLGERLSFVSEAWFSAKTLRQLLTQLPAGAGSGDIYARLQSKGKA